MRPFNADRIRDILTGRSALAGLVVMCSVGLLAAEAGAQQITVTALNLYKSEFRIGSSISFPGGFYFEACATATGVNTESPGFIVRPNSSQFDALISVGNDTYCFVARFNSFQGLDNAYPSTGGTYTFKLAPTSGSPALIDYTVVFNVAHPPDNPVIVEPFFQEKVISDRDLLVRWGNLASCAFCDGIEIAASDTNRVLYSSPTALPQSARSSFVPNAVLSTDTMYAVQVVTFDGPATPIMDTQQSSTFTVDALYLNSNAVTDVTGVDRTIDLTAVELFKGTFREDGTVPVRDGHFFQACVEGTGIAPSPNPAAPSTFVVHPDGFNIPLQPDPLASPPFTLLCFQSPANPKTFDDRASLDMEFPSDGGTYTFRITQADGAQIKIPIVWDDAQPGATIAYTSPAHQSTVPSNRDLVVRWNLDKGTPPCSAPGTCGDFIAFFFIEEQGQTQVFDLEVPITATSQTVNASQLTEGKSYLIETETYNGLLNMNTTDGPNDAYVFTRANEEVNLIRVTAPEPGALALQAAALASVVWLGRRRRSR